MTGIRQVRPALVCAALVAVMSSPAAAQQKKTEIVGLTEPSRTVRLAAAETGLLSSVDVKEGDTVNAGQVVAQLDDSVLRASLAIAKAQMEAKGELRAAEADLTLKKERLRKLRALLPEGHATDEEVAIALSEMEAAEARLLSAHESRIARELEHARIRVQIEMRKVRSRITGVVSELHREASEFVSYTDPIVMTIVQLDPLVATFTLYPHQVAEYKLGTSVRVALTSSTRIAQGEVTFVSPTLDGESGTLRVEVELPNPDGRYRSGDKCRLLSTTQKARLGEKPQTSPTR